MNKTRTYNKMTNDKRGENNTLSYEIVCCGRGNREMSSRKYICYGIRGLRDPVGIEDREVSKQQNGFELGSMCSGYQQ